MDSGLNFYPVPENCYKNYYYQSLQAYNIEEKYSHLRHFLLKLWRNEILR
jgi:hypothetical protein